MKNIRIYIIALIIFFTIDIIWLGFIGKNIYGEHLGFLMREKTNWAAAIIFYMFYIIGLVFFCTESSYSKR